MRKFIKKIIIFLGLFVLLLCLGFILPSTPRASKSLLFASVNKNILLQDTPPPRIIFIGGSNISFGLNSQVIQETLSLNPINTAIHAGIGLKYMLDSSIEYIRSGDIVVLIPEYCHYFKNINLGSEELMRTIFDVDMLRIKYLNKEQIKNILLFLPKYCLTKYNLKEYFFVVESDVYSINSFNQYGDVFAHWELDSKNVTPFGSIDSAFNSQVVDMIKTYNSQLLKKNARLFISFPGLQDKTFDNQIEAIRIVEHNLNQSGLKILGSPERYKMPDEMMFDTPYHLNKEGVERRTNLLIEDIREAMDNLKVDRTPLFGVTHPDERR